MNQAALLRRSRKNHRTARKTTRTVSAPPLRLTPALCGALAAVLCLWQGAGARAAEKAPEVKPSSSVLIASNSESIEGALVRLKVGGKPLAIPFPVGAKFTVTGDTAAVQANPQHDALLVMALTPGRVVLTIEIPAADGSPAALLSGVSSLVQKYTLRIADEKQAESTSITVPAISVLTTAPVAGAQTGGIPERQPALTMGKFMEQHDVIAAPPSPVTMRSVFTPRATAPEAPVLTAKNGTEKPVSPATKFAQAEKPKAARLTPVVASKPGANLSKPVRLAQAQEPAERTEADVHPQISLIASAQMTPREVAPVMPGIVPAANTNKGGTVAASFVIETPEIDPGNKDSVRTAAAAAAGTPAPAEATAASPVTNDADAVVTPDVPPPVQLPTGTAAYPLQASLPPDIDPTAKRPLYRVSQGMARLLAFKKNILSVFFSDDVSMDARAVNARTIAVTGKNPGKSTLAVFLSRYPGDAVGRAVIYNIEVFPAASRLGHVYMRAEDAELAIRTALNDPRVRVTVLQRPDGQLVAQLTGALRDQAEVSSAVAVTSMFVPNVISGLYVDPKAPTLSEALVGPSLQGEALLQAQLQKLFSNDSIELVQVANGLMLKAEVNSPAEAEALLSILPTLNRQIQPLIVIRGGGDGQRYYTPTRPLLYGENYEMTRVLGEVTGVSTVYAVRTARNAIAVYGTARNRSEYDTVRRYATTLLPQIQEVSNSSAAATPNTPTATTATTTTSLATAPALASATGLAPAPSTASLTGLKDSQAPASGNQTPVQIQMFVRVLDEAGSQVRLVTVESNVVEINRKDLKNLGAQYGTAEVVSVAPTTLGETTIGEGLLGDFSGSGAFSNINPIRVRLDALIQNGAARVLSKPNLSVIEGGDAQITIGGVRPVPETTSTASAGGSSQTSIKFRRFGIILTMRPTLTDDDTIILQIRGDVTSLDFTTAIDLGGAVIPGESVRSVDTTVTIREGDTLVLGGLMTNDTRKTFTKVPLLGDIPILGSLFRSKKFENNETELAMFLTPRIRRQNASPETGVAVRMVPSLPELPSLQDERENAFGLSTAGSGGS